MQACKIVPIDRGSDGEEEHTHTAQGSWLPVCWYSRTVQCCLGDTRDGPVHTCIRVVLRWAVSTGQNSPGVVSCWLGYTAAALAL